MGTNGTGPHLALPRIEVTLDDGRVEVAQVLNQDLLRWDITAAKHSWPNFQEVRTWHATFCAWAALRRTGQIPKDWTWEAFSEEHAVQVRALDREGNPVEGEDADVEELEADPTRPVAAPG